MLQFFGMFYKIFEHSIFAIKLYHTGIFARLKVNEHFQPLICFSTRHYTYLLYFVK